jgi:OOP family OmpA-OmpF porin
MRLKTAMAVSLAAAGLGLSPFAIGQAPAQERGWYVGGSIGQTDAKGDCPAGASCDFKDTSWKLFGGYRINRNFAAELFYGDWGKVTATRGAISAKGEISSLGIAALGIFPVGRQFELFGRAGLARTEQKLSGTGPGVTITDRDSGSELIWGFGAAFNFTRNFGLRGEWERLNDSKVDILSIGLQYKF